MADGVDQQQTTDTVEEPLDLIRLSLDEWIHMKWETTESFEAGYMLMINI